MSPLDSLTTAVTGMSAQATALANISDNVANSQTVGFKAVNTTFADYVTQAAAEGAGQSSVVAQQQYTNDEQGSITQVSSPTSLAISGQGYFAVAQPASSSNGVTMFSSQPYYTRVGDFETDKSGYLINSSGYALEGWAASSTASGVNFNTSTLAPIQISKAPSEPVATSNISFSGNLPSTPSTDTVSNPYGSTIQVFDKEGNAQSVNLSWSQVGQTNPTGPISSSNPAVPNEWNLTVTGGNPSQTSGPMLVTFGSTSADAGTIQSIAAPASAGTLAVSPPSQSGTGAAATITLPLNFGLGTQSVALNLGTFGSTSGMTQFAGTSYQITSQSQDGAAQGNFSSVTIKPTGDVVINYDNGTTNTIARIPLANFNNPNGLIEHDGQTFSPTSDSGSANVESAGTGGAGTMVVGSVESSNVDIATQFTSMIVAQRAYTANSKIITTANEMMQDTLNMVQG